MLYEFWLDHHASDRSLEHELVAHNALRLADEAAAIELDLLGEQQKAVAGQNLTAKDDIIAAGKPEESVCPPEPCMEQAAHLRCGFDHEYPRKDRAPWNVPLHPELIVAYQALADGGGSVLGDPDDPVDHPHMPSLRQVLIDLFLVAKCRAEVDIVDGEK